MLVLAGLIAAPVKRLDVAELEPVEVVYFDVQNDMCYLITDTGAEGCGDTIDAALENMKSATPAVVYLDTAEYLLVSEKAIGELDEVRKLVKDSVQVCCAQNPDMKIAANYLETHEKLPKLKEVKGGDRLPFWKS